MKLDKLKERINKSEAKLQEMAQLLQQNLSLTCIDWVVGTTVWFRHRAPLARLREALIGV